MAKRKSSQEPMTTEALARARVSIAHDAPARRGDWVLYWLRALRRAEDNLALDHAAARADELGLPLIVYESLDPRYPYASARMHTFVLESTLGRRAAIESKGAAYRFALPRTAREAREGRALSTLAARAALIVSDWFAPCGAMATFWRDSPARLGQRSGARVELVDDTVGVPMALFADRHEVAARTIRPKVQRVVSASLTVSDERSVRAKPPRELHLPFDHCEITAESIPSLVASCEVDARVGPVARTPGTRAEAERRLRRFIDQRLERYSEGRNDMGLVGSSELSAYLHFGVLSGRAVARAAMASAAPERERAAFVEELIVRRALAFNHVMTCADGASSYERAVPEWARMTLEAHAGDARTAHRFEQWESAQTSDPLWNSAQRELLRDGVIHPYARMLWGKVALTLAPSPREAFEWLIALNDKWALDGRDPNTYTNIAWCFGLHDHPYPERAVFGTVRSMTSAAARRKWDTDAYEARVASLEAP
jgi:deoxyribodipyrimidine photo-lyase